MRHTFGFFLVLFILIISSCAPTRFVEPLEKGEHAVSANFGGPLIHFSGMVIPLPLTALTYGYGLDSNTTGFASIHTTALAFGVFQNEWGINRKILSQKNIQPAVSCNLVANTAFDKWEKQFKFWPELDLNAYWHLKNPSRLIYVGIGNWFELSKYRAHDELQPVHWIFNPHIGYRYTHNKWTYFVEGKILAPNISNQKLVVDYLKPWGEKGASGIYLGILKKF